MMMNGTVLSDMLTSFMCVQLTGSRAVVERVVLASQAPSVMTPYFVFLVEVNTSLAVVERVAHAMTI